MRAAFCWACYHLYMRWQWLPWWIERRLLPFVGEHAYKDDP